MIRTVADLRSLSTDVIKIAQNTDPTKTEGKRLLGLITDILDTVDDLVLQQGLSISANMQQQRLDILSAINTDLININSSIQQYITTNAPDLSIFQKKSDVITYDLSKYQLLASSFMGDYGSLTNKPDLTKFRLVTDAISYTDLLNKPTIPTLPDLTSYAKKTDIPPIVDLTPYQKTTDQIAYSRLSGVPTPFSGNYNDLISKPVIPTYDLSVYQKTTDSISYSRLTNTPTIPTYDLSPYALKTQLPVVPVYDFSIYALKTQIPTIPDLSVYALKSQLPVIPDLSSYALKTQLFDGTWNSLSGKPTLFSGSYTDLTNKPNIPIYDLSLYRLKTDAIDYTTLTNKPSISKLLWNQLAVTPVANTTSETNILVTGNGTLMIDANPAIGTAFRLTGRGLFSTQSVTTPTLVVKIWMGSVVIASGTVSSLLLGANNKTLSFTVDIVIVATNTIYAQGGFNYYGSATDALSSTPLLNGIGTNSMVDLTTSNQLKMTVAWSAASTSNQILVKIANLEKLN